jgi:hypothetical protein
VLQDLGGGQCTPEEAFVLLDAEATASQWGLRL